MRSALLRLVASAAVIATAAPVYAQAPRPDRPYRGLFGSGPQGTTQLLTLNVDFGAGYDTDVLAAENVGVQPEGEQVASRFSTANAGLSYSIGTERISFFASARASLHYYQGLTDSNEPWVERYGFGGGGAWRITTRTTLTFNQTATRDPFYSLLPGSPADGQPGQPVIIDPTGSVQADRHWTYGSASGLSHQVTRRLTVYGNASRFISRSNSEDFDLTSWTLGGGGVYQLTRDLSARLGYTYTEAEFENGNDPTNSKSIDGGLEYSKGISLSRRTKLDFGTGVAGSSDGDDTRYTLVGHVGLNYEIGRSWNAGVSYLRDVGFSDLLQEPVLTDSFHAMLSGLIARRLEASASAGVSRGELGLGDDSSMYNTVENSAGVTYGLTRNIGLSVNYTYYHYDFDQSLALPGGLPNETRRHSVVGLVKLWTPLYQRPRSPNASR